MKNSKKITFGKDGSMTWSSKDKFYYFMIGDGVLNISDLQLVCGPPSGLVTNYDSPAEALADLKDKHSELISNYCEHEYFSFTQFPDGIPGNPLCVKCGVRKDG